MRVWEVLILMTFDIITQRLYPEKEGMVYENYYSFCEYTQCQWLAFISQITQNSNKKKEKSTASVFKRSC